MARLFTFGHSLRWAAWGPTVLNKSDEYRRHAGECRVLARHMQNAEYRKQLLAMAETWEGLAIERERVVAVNHNPGKTDL
jgi:hypothetical protein